jgi:hypothetical protein
MLHTGDMRVWVKLLGVFVGINSINPELSQMREVFGHHEELMLFISEVFPFIKVVALGLLLSVYKALAESTLFILDLYADLIELRVVH